jgi:hypothetical protein
VSLVGELFNPDWTRPGALAVFLKDSEVVNAALVFRHGRAQMKRCFIAFRPVWKVNFYLAPHTERSSLRPTAQGRLICQACRIFPMRCCLLSRVACSDLSAGLLPTLFPARH